LGEKERQSMKKFSLHFPWLLGIFLVGMLLTRNLWGTRALIETHDGIFHLIRQEVFAEALKLGQFPVRWIPSLDNGYGLPLFNYIYPGPYYLGSVFSLLGLSSKWVLKIVEIGLYLLGGFGVYFLLAQKNKLYALLSSLLYLTTPYLLVNLFVRGALGEFMAISLIPWVLVALQDMSKKGTLKWYHPIPYFLLLISHNFLSFLFFPIYCIVTATTKVSWKLSLKSLLLSLGHSAFFVIPMILEQGLLYSVATGNFTYNFADHFIYPIQLLYSQWGIGHSYAGLNDGFSFALGYANLAVLVVAILTLIYKRSQALMLYGGLTLTILFFLLPVSQPIWNVVTPIQMIQFPWRLLSLTTITIPLLSFYLLLEFRRFRYLLPVALLVLCLNMGFALSYTTPFYFQSNDQLATQLYIHRDKTTTSSRAEILPRWSPLKERYPGEEIIKIQSGNGVIKEVIITGWGIHFTATSDQVGTKYLIKRNYFPSWYGQDESGHKLLVTPDDSGEMVVEGVPGIHTYKVYVGSTPVQVLANLFSLATILYLLSMIIRPKIKSYIDERFSNWDISIALRYLPIVDALKKKTKPSDKILEVGSEISGITTYYPRSVTGLDQGFDYKRQNKYLKPVEGSAVAMPFKDQSFDYVISVDCIEHIPPKLRAKAVSEMLRVARKQIYLTFPVGPHSESIDKMLDLYFYQKNGEHFTYLTEHVENGLPGFDFVPNIVTKHKEWDIKVQGNTSTWLWVMLLKMGFSNIQWLTSIYRRLLLFLPVIKYCNFGSCYRQLYILTRKKE
jgi:hypothetical protein